MKDTHKLKQNVKGGYVRIPDFSLKTVAGSHQLEMPGEWKTHNYEDPFDDTLAARNGGSVLKQGSETANKTLGQLIVYANLAFEKCPRTRVFSFLCAEDRGRLLFWDRSGLVVTKAFDWREDDTLERFFWRYSHMSPEARGHDTTIKDDVSREHAKIARSAMAYLVQLKLITEDILKAMQFRSIKVVDARNGEEHRLIATEAYKTPNGVEGSATSCYYAVNIAKDKNKVLHVKDTWRNRAPEFAPEGEIYDLLHEHNVKYIPRHSYSGDVVGEYQRTIVNTLPNPPEDSVFFDRQHYRIVHETIGRPLTAFENTYELTLVVRDAIEGTDAIS
jgi:hypothetical protein